MAPNNFINALIERCRIEPAGYTQRNADVVRNAFRFQLVQEPQPLLGERKRRRLVCRTSGNHARRGVLINSSFQEPLELLPLQGGECSFTRREFCSSPCQCVIYFSHVSPLSQTQLHQYENRMKTNSRVLLCALLPFKKLPPEP